MFKDGLNKSSGKCALRIGMRCKAQTTAIAVAMARICNAADRPTPQMRTARRLVQTILKYGLVLLWACSSCVFASDVDKVLREADSFRLPNGSVRIETEVRLYRNDKLDKDRLYTVYIKPPRRSLVLMKSPVEIGQKLLMLGEKFWLLTTDSQRPLRITSSQKLLGEASTGDIANMTWSEDYKGDIVGEINCPKPSAQFGDINLKVLEKFSTCMQLNLKANTEGLTYSNIILFVDIDSKTPVKAELFVDSGKKAKDAWYLKLRDENSKFIDTMLLVDNIQTTRYTVVNYKKIETKEIPDEIFNPAALVRNALPGW